MGLLAESNLINAASIILGLILIAAIFVKRKYSYWKRRGVPYIEPSFPCGNAGVLLSQKKSFGNTFKDVYLDMKSTRAMHVGYYFLLMPQYVPIDPELIKHILQKDFQHFVDRGVFSNERDEPLNTNLFTMEGAQWKSFRSKLTPTFSSGKIKMMFPYITDACKELLEVLEQSPSDEAIEIKDLLARLTTDIIGTCAFGIECNSLKDPDAEFRKYGRRIFVQTTWQKITGFFAFVLPTVGRFLGVTMLPKDVHDFFMRVIKETVYYRETQNIRRNDFMHLLLQIKNRGKLEDDETQLGDVKPMAVEEIAGQAFVFFLAGFETSSTTMSFCLYELAGNEAIQEKLRKEIIAVLGKHDGRLTYEALNEMPYMDMVVSETLRKYPPVPVLNRICTKDYQIPNSNVKLEKGVQVVIPIEGLHYDPEFYPNPEAFDPDRFTDESKTKRHPYSYLPFGEGPRVCVGLRFGLVQTKAGLALLLKNYKFTLNPKTTRPLQMDPASFLTSAIDGIWMNITKIES